MEIEMKLNKAQKKYLSIMLRHLKKLGEGIQASHERIKREQIKQLTLKYIVVKDEDETK